MWFEESHAIDLWNSSVLAVPIGFYAERMLCIAGQGKAPLGSPFLQRNPATFLSANSEGRSKILGEIRGREDRVRQLSYKDISIHGMIIMVSNHLAIRRPQRLDGDRRSQRDYVLIEPIERQWCRTVFFQNTSARKQARSFPQENSAGNLRWPAKNVDFRAKFHSAFLHVLSTSKLGEDTRRIREAIQNGVSLLK